MNLQEILASVGINFAAGFSWGFIGLAEKLNDRIDLVEYGMKKEEREKKGYDQSKIKYVRGIASINRFMFPLAFGLSYSVYNNPNLNAENYGVAIPSAIAGSLVGGLAGKVFRNWRNKDEDEKELRAGIKELKKIQKKFGISSEAVIDPENLDKYLLNEEQQARFNQAFSDLEKTVVEGHEIDKDGEPTERFQAAMKIMYETLTENNKPYSQALLKWSAKKWGKIVDRAVAQRKVSEFYELKLCNECPKAGECEDKACKNIELPQATTLGKAEHARVKVFVREGDEFYTADLEWPELKMVRFDEQRAELYSPGKINFTCRERTPWTGDYRRIAEQALEAGKSGYSVIMAKFPAGFPEPIKKLILTMGYLPEYQEHQLSGNKNDGDPTQV